MLSQYRLLKATKIPAHFSLCLKYGHTDGLRNLKLTKRKELLKNNKKVVENPALKLKFPWCPG